MLVLPPTLLHNQWLLKCTYLLKVWLQVSLVQWNWNPWNGFSNKMVTSFIRFCINMLPIYWHWSQIMLYSWTFWFNGPIITKSKIFCIVMLKKKCPTTPPWRFCSNVGTYSNYKTRWNLLSCPNQYCIPFQSIKGLSL